MNKNMYYSILLGMLLSQPLSAISYSFFRPRSITTDAAYELSMSNYFFYKNYIYNPCEKRIGFAFFAAPFYQRSTNRNNPARYFLPQNKCSVHFTENGTGNVNSLWLSLIAPAGASFSSRLSLKPLREVYGAYLQAYFDLAGICPNTWVSICTAAIEARHSLRLCEWSSTNDGTLVAQGAPLSNVTTALNNPTWQFGRFSVCTLKKGGVDDLQIKIGRNWFYNDCTNHYSFYAVLTAPTGSASKARYIFEPLVGSRNTQLGFGINADYTCWETECSQLLLMTDFKYQYGFGAQECRSFDLCPNGDWSRYLQITTSNNVLSSQSGINIFTQRTKVIPRSHINWWLALHHATYECWHSEFGYNFWYRQAESITCLAPLPIVPNGGSFGIFDIGGLCSVATTANTATICESLSQVASDTTFIALDSNRLHKKSGAHPRAISHKFYGTIGRERDIPTTNISYMTSIGGSYEFAQSFTALDSWAIWCKLGIFF